MKTRCGGMRDKRMAKQKIKFEKEYGEDSRNTYYFTGSQRQPTINEILSFIKDNRLEDEIDDYFLILAINPKADMDSGYFLGEEENKTVEFWGYDGGQGKYNSGCPICGHERDMGGDVCPVCNKPW